MAKPKKIEQVEDDGVLLLDNVVPLSTIRRQLKQQWFSLHPDIRIRFRRDPEPGERVVYDGVMQEIRRSKMGWLFAQLTRVIGNPLTPYAGQGVPMRVTLYKKRGRKGVFWERAYHYEGRKPFVVTSAKQESERGEMMECVGGGFGMVLKVYAQDESLHFESTRYFWQALGLRVSLPHWLAPGKTHVVHENISENEFRFTITMTHDHLGETFYQTGTFRPAGAAPCS